MNDKGMEILGSPLTSIQKALVRVLRWEGVKLYRQYFFASDLLKKMLENMCLFKRILRPTACYNIFAIGFLC